MDNVCRTCLTYEGNKTSIFNSYNESENSFSYIEMIKDVASVQVSLDDGFSSLICKLCIDNLQKAFAFRMQCQKADAIIRQCKENSINIKSESFNDDESLEKIEIKTEVDVDLKETNEDVIETIEESKFVIKTPEEEPTLDTNEVTINSKQNDNHLYEINEEGEVQYPCFVCKEVFKIEEDFINHTIIHNEHKPYICRQCGNCYKKSFGLKVHYKIHKTGSHCCEICGKKYSWASDLKMHMRYHTGDLPFPCTHCDKGFRSSYALKFHLQQHTGIKLHTCELCGKSISNILYHMRMHKKDKRYSCGVCNKKFVTKSEKSVHMVVHTGDKKYVCEVCNKGFGWGSNLRKHMLIHTNNRAFVCDLCGKDFIQKQALKKHMRTHVR